MKIAITSYRFPPDFGGIETVSRILAEELSARGHNVSVLTTTQHPKAASNSSSPDIAYAPSSGALLRAIADADVVLQNNISLNLAWPAWLLRKPQVIIHQTWIYPPGEQPKLSGRLKRRLARSCEQIAISRPVADQWHNCRHVWGNPYDSDCYRNLNLPRSGDLIFVGRLVSAKGCDVLIDALTLLKDQDLRPELTIIGDGPERAFLETRIAESGLTQQVRFLGKLDRTEIAEQLNRHKILVVPSKWQEPFGIVAVEGSACGCCVIGTSGGGLPEAIGAGGIVVPNSDAQTLAKTIGDLLRNPDRITKLGMTALRESQRYTTSSWLDRIEELLLKTSGKQTSHDPFLASHR